MSFEKDNDRLIKKKKKEAMFKIASIIQAEAVRRCPVSASTKGHTGGKLRQSIHIVKYDDKEAIVGTNVPYACVVGSRHSIYCPNNKLNGNIGSYPYSTVLSKDGKAHKVIKRHKFSQTGKDELEVVSIRINKKINPLLVTENHLILILRDSYLQWMSARELRRTDKVFRKRSHNAITNNSNKTKFVCVCGKEFLVENSSLKHRTPKYCSQKCYYRYTHHNRNEGKHWTLKESQKRYDKDNPAWNNGSSFEPYDWRFNNKLRKQVKKRDKYTCQICGSKRQLVIHHMDWNKENSNIDNLVTLCRSCHGKQKRLDCELPIINLDKFKPISILELKRITLKRKRQSHLPNIYDLSIKNENSFVCGGILIHNSYVEYGTKAMVKAHGSHDVTNPVTDWEAKRKRGGVGQTMPFLRSSLYFNRGKISKIIKEVFEK